MKTRTGVLRLVPVFLWLLPAAALAQAQGKVGPWQQFSPGSFMMTWTTAGPLAFFTTVVPTYPPQPFIQGFLRSDGTPQGTFSIDPRGPATPEGQAGINIASSLGGLLFFTTALNSAPEDRALWRTDGTVAGTFPVTQGLSVALDYPILDLPAARSVPERGLLFFSAGARSERPDFELWATDGTAEGTRLVADVNPEGASHPRSMIELAGRVFFLADTPEGRELWRSDGTPEGTERVLDLHEPGTGVSLARAGDALFVVVSSASDLEVWRSDGTEAGTVRVLELPMLLQRFQAAGRNLFVVTRDAAGQELWAVDGDGEGETEAVRVLDMPSSPGLVLSPAGDHVIFALEDDQGREPWGSDGTPEGTRRIADLCPGPCSSFASYIGTYGGRAVVAADDGVSGLEPWLTDGTAAGTFRLGDLCPGSCAGGFVRVQELGGWLVLLSGSRVWISDGTRDGAWSAGDLWAAADWLVALPGRILFAKGWGGDVVPLLGHLPVTAPAPPPGGWLESARVPGFRFKVRIDGQTPGRLEPSCMARTLCVSGALPGRSEVFVRWPSLVKLTTSTVEVWALETTTGQLRYYRLEGTGPTGITLAGTLDREGFGSAPGTPAPAVAEARAPKPPQPPGRWIESKTAPGFGVQARLTADGKSRLLRKEPCAVETFCLSGAVPGLTDLLIRVSGPKPNGYYWPMLARFTPATLEVWIEQRKTGKVRYYRLNPPPAGSSALDGLFDRLGFKR